MRNNKIVLRVLVSFFVVVIILTFCSKSLYNYRLPIVFVTRPKSGTLDFSIKGNSEIDYGNKKKYYTEKDGIVRSIFVKKGDFVKKSEKILEVYLPDKNKKEIIKAMVEGIVTDIFVESGMYVSYMSNSALYEMAENTHEWNVVLSVSDTEARNLQRGDKALINVNENVGFEGEIDDLIPYASEEGSGCHVSVKFVSTDESLAMKKAEVTVINYSDNYDTVLPVDSLREDSNGYFVYVLQSDDGVLGNGYLVQRTSVELLDSDISYCAVVGITDADIVVESSTKEIGNGDHVYYEGNDESGDEK